MGRAARMNPPMDSPFHSSAGRDAAPSLLDRIRRALEQKDLEALAELYTEDACLEEVSSLSPPSHPAVLRGRDAILARLRREILHDPVSGWTRRLESATVMDGLETADALAFTEVRTYVAGDKAIAQHVAHKVGGKIDRDRVVCAWDAD
jgi:hypothetical protein